MNASQKAMQPSFVTFLAPSMSAVVSVEYVAFDGIILGGEVLEDLIQTVGLDDLVRDDEVVLGAEIDALLRLLDAADDAAGNA